MGAFPTRRVGISLLLYPRLKMPSFFFKLDKKYLDHKRNFVMKADEGLTIRMSLFKIKQKHDTQPKSVMF
jgi:hypothetical protein